MRRIARGMKSLEVKPDLILTSPFIRAHQTAEIVAKVLKCEKRLQMAPALEPDGNPKELIDSLKNNFRKRTQVLLIGHEPYLSRLISLLISGDTRIAITLKKGGLCLLSTESLQYGRCATLEWLMSPGQLRSVR
jgi:phosphohistidine phosphatase